MSPQQNSAALMNLKAPVSSSLPFDGRRAMLLGMLAIALMGLLFATFVRVDRVVVGRGALVPVDDRSDVRLSTGGVVSEVLVGESEFVRAGQELLRLEDAATRAEYLQLRRDLQAAERAVVDTTAAVEGIDRALRGEVPGPVSDTDAANKIDVWRRALLDLAEAKRNHDSVLPHEIELAKAQLAGRKAQARHQEAQLRQAKARFDRDDRLFSRGLIAASTHDEATVARSQAQSLLDEAKAGVRAGERELRVLTEQSKQRLERSQELLDVAGTALEDERARLRGELDVSIAERDMLAARILSTERVLDFTVVRAPVDGLISAATRAVPGDRVEAGARLFSLEASSLVFVEADFANSDAGRLKPGAACRVKLDAFPYETYGAIAGRIESIALEPIQQGEVSVYPVRVALKRASVRVDGHQQRLLPGMALNVDVVTDQPRLIAYLFEAVGRLLGQEMSHDPLVAESMPSGENVEVSPQSPFDSSRALQHVVQLAVDGGRPYGSQALVDAQAYVIEELKSLGLEPRVHSFKARTPAGVREFRNIYATIEGVDDSEKLLVAHVDTKALPAMSGFQGANESASGVATLLECARVLRQAAQRSTVHLAFLDGKEAAGRSGLRDGLYGSEELARQLTQGGHRIGAALVCDMVGDSDLLFTDELRSNFEVAAGLRRAGERLGYVSWFESARTDSVPLPVQNDHIPLIRAGIPTALLCDFDFGGADTVRKSARNRFWRTEHDRVESISTISLQVAGDLVFEFCSGRER